MVSFEDRLIHKVYFMEAYDTIVIKQAARDFSIQSILLGRSIIQTTYLNRLKSVLSFLKHFT